MSDIKNKVQGLDPNVRARDLGKLVGESRNIYETLAVVSKRSRQLSVDLKAELNGKLEEFAVQTDTIEEVSENKEQVEISKFYERLPNPVIIAMEEYLEGDIYFRYNQQKDKSED